MYFISRIFQALKVTVATAGLIGACLVLGYGIIAAKTVYIVGGSLCLLQSGMLFFDSSKVLMDIKKQIERLKKNIDEFRYENLQLQYNVEKLEKAKDAIVSQTTKLEKSLERGKEQLDKLEKLKNKYETLSKELEENLDKEKKSVATLENQTEIFKVQNHELERQATTLIEVKNQLEFENSDLKNTIILIKGELSELEILKKNYLVENTKLQESVIAHRQQLEDFKAKNEVLDGSLKNFEEENGHLQMMLQQDEAQLETLKNQVLKLKELYDNSRQLLVNLATAGDMFTQFQTSIGNNVISLQTTSQDLNVTENGLSQTLETMKNLLIKLQDTSFQKLDSDGDGLVTQEEFNTNIEKL